MTDATAASYELLKDVTAPCVSDNAQLSSKGKVVQVKGLTTAGSGSAMFEVWVSNKDDYPWRKAGSLYLILSTVASTDSLILDADWSYVRIKLVSISGTGAKVSGSVGV